MTRSRKPAAESKSATSNVLPYPEGVSLPQVYRCRLALVREATVPAPPEEIFLRPSYVAPFLWREFFHDLDREALVAAYLNARNHLIGYTVAYIGGLQRGFSEPRGLLVPGLLINAAGLVLAHNHPSEDPTPSVEDLMFTRKMAKAAELLDMRLVDHVILGSEGNWLSMRERGGW